MTTVAHPDLVFLGNLLVDDIVLRDGSTLMGEPGGAVLHAALAAALWGAKVGICSVAGTDYPRHALDALAARSIDLAGVRHLERTGGRAWLLYEPAVRRTVHHLDCPSHADVSPTLDDVPDPWAAARAFHLAPMPLERQLELAHGLAPQTPGSRLVSLDPFELVRDGTLTAWREVLTHVDLFFVSEDEWRLAGDADAIIPALAGPRLAQIAFKRGARGGRLVDLHAKRSRTWTSRANDVVDATGAGDAFAGGFLAGLVTHGDVSRAIEQGIVAASFAIEDWGARGLVAATPAAAAARHDEWFAGTKSGATA
jgi:sugar/nucleoside kinase (ribokinase family)